MRFSSLVSLVVVTASFALGGCAADAEHDSTFDAPIVKHEGDLDSSRIRDVRATDQRSDEGPSPIADATRARAVETYAGGVANPRIDSHPPVFGHAPSVPAAERVNERGDLAGARAADTLSSDDIVGVVDDHTAAAALTLNTPSPK